DKLASARNFANKIWNAARFLFVNLDKFEGGGTKLEELAAPEVRAKAPYAYRSILPLADEWLFGRLMATTSVMNTALANYRFQEVITNVRNIRAELKLDPRKKVAAEVYSSYKDIREQFARNFDGILRLAILSDLSVSADRLPQEGGAVRSTSLFDVRIAYSDT